MTFSEESKLEMGKIIWTDVQGKPITMLPNLEDSFTNEAMDIINRIFPQWLDLFLEKQADYGESSDDLGMKGDFADMHRKWKKLRRSMWEDIPLRDPNETTRKVLLDMIGHCFRAIHHGDTRGWLEDGFGSGMHKDI